MPKRSLFAFVLAVLVFSGCGSKKTAPVAGSTQPTDAVTTPANPNPDAATKGNMRNLQIAVENYANDHRGTYPSSLAVLRSLLDRPPTNAVTGVGDWPIFGSITSVETARQGLGDPNPLGAISPGAVEYSAIDYGASYAIRGGGADGYPITHIRGQTLVLSDH